MQKKPNAFAAMLPPVDGPLASPAALARAQGIVGRRIEVVRFRLRFGFEGIGLVVADGRHVVEALGHGTGLKRRLIGIGERFSGKSAFIKGRSRLWRAEKRVCRNAALSRLLARIRHERRENGIAICAGGAALGKRFC